MDYDYLIVGAGLFGAVFAHEMRERGKRVLVVERRPHVAGNIYTETVMDIQVHRYGAHIFHTSDRGVWEYVNRFATFNPFVNSPMAVYRDEIYNLPFNMNTFSRMWNVKTPEQAKRIMDAQIAAEGIGEPKNLEEQALSLVGRDVYEKLIKGYTEKQWGRDCRDLPASIIRRIPVRFTYDNNYFNDVWQGIPEGGYTAMVEKLLEGCTVLLDTSWEAFCQGNRLKQPEERIHWRKLVYTGRIDEYFHECLGSLQYRSLRFETEELPDVDNYQGCAVVNYTDREIPWTRIIEHKHFEHGTGKGTVITREYPAPWQSGAEPYTPVNDGTNDALYGRYRELALKERDVIFGGRLGSYRYCDMDRVVRSALDAAAGEPE